MAYQLVYTSSPRGLKPGAFGFCVVACTRGMKEQTTSALEALSGYRRVYADPRDALRNPTSYSHVLFETATGRLRILARVADAGLDYSGRTNKIASFLDVATGELTPPGPAALFSQPGLFVTNWSSSSTPQYYEAPIALPNYVPIPPGCDEWRNTTGDPAWAGVLASTVATRRPVALIVRPEQNVLRLFQESLALLPPGERWNATFSTYYMKTPPGVQCQWKAVMQGSPEELASRSTPGVLVLDLTAPNRLPSVASLVATPEAKALVAAASGRFQRTDSPTNAASASSNFPTPPPASGYAPLPGAAPIGAQPPHNSATAAPSDETAPKRKTLDYGRDAVLTVATPPRRGSRETALLTRVLACVGAATILCGIVIAFMWTSGVFKNFVDAKKTYDEVLAEANGQPSEKEENQTDEVVESGEKSGVWISEDEENKNDDEGNENDEVTPDDGDFWVDEESDSPQDDVGGDVILKSAAADINKALTSFKKEGGVENLKEAERLLNEYPDAKELIEERNAFKNVKEALLFKSFKSSRGNGKEIQKALSGDQVDVQKKGVYDDITSFFNEFNWGSIRLTFHFYDGDAERPEWKQVIVKSADLRKVKERPNPPRILECDLSDSDDSTDVFFVDVAKQTGGLSFWSIESARKYLLGTLKIEAFATPDADEKSRVFSSSETPLLNASDISAQESLDLSWLFGDRLPKLVNQESREADALFLDFVKDMRKLTVELSPSKIADIRSDVQKRSRARDRSDLKSFSILLPDITGKRNMAATSDYALEVGFTIANVTKIESDGIRLYKFVSLDQNGLNAKNPGWHDVTPTTSLPEGVGGAMFKFNVRYRAYEGQKKEDSPIVGVLSVPATLGGRVR